MEVTGLALGRISEEDQHNMRFDIVRGLRNSGYGDNADKALEILYEFREEYSALISRFETRLVTEANTCLGELHATLTSAADEIEED